VLGDLDEKYYTATEKKTSLESKVQLLVQVFKLRQTVCNKKTTSIPQNNTAMLKNYSQSASGISEKTPATPSSTSEGSLPAWP